MKINDIIFFKTNKHDVEKNYNNYNLEDILYFS